MDHLPMTVETVTSRILTLRGQRVMLDLDLASCTASPPRRSNSRSAATSTDLPMTSCSSFQKSNGKY
jgi:hypothetical protein